jgi:serine/threonine-protein kinase
MPARDRYVLADQLGVGGMGTVWRAWDRHERRWVAAKLVDPYDAHSLERFVREQDVVVRHRHVVQPRDRAALACGGAVRTFFTMDLVKGGSLELLLARQGPLPEAYVRIVLEQVLQALTAVHAAGIVHRDVKPGNLLLEPTGTGRPWVRLGDFGVAAVAGDPRLTRGPGGVGTGGYMSPEKATGGPPDPRQDLYAAGVVAGQLLTGGDPGDPPPPGDLGRVLGTLTAPDPELRPRTASLALELLRGVGVPPDAPWRGDPNAPHVVDLYGDPSPPGRTFGKHVPSYAWSAPAVFAGAGLTGGLATWLVAR